VTVTVEAQPRRKRIWLRWLIALVVIVVLLIVAWFVGDRIARDYAEDYISDQIVASFPGTEPDVTLGSGSILAQAIGGELDSVHVVMDDVTFGDISGNVVLDADGVPLDSAKTIDTLDVGFTLSESGVASIVGQLDGLEDATTTLGDKEISLASTFSVLGIDIPLSLSLSPSVAEDALVLTPTTVSVNGAEISLSDIASSPFGGAVSNLVKPQAVCVTQYLPSALTLTGASVVGSTLRLDIVGEDISLATTDFETLGTC
jgi:hypothetical protein